MPIPDTFSLVPLKLKGIHVAVVLSFKIWFFIKFFSFFVKNIFFAAGSGSHFDFKRYISSLSICAYALLKISLKICLPLLKAKYFGVIVRFLSLF